MKNKKSSKTKLKFLGLTLCVFGFFIITNTSYAVGVIDIVTNPGKSLVEFFSWGITIVLYILSTIFASILMIGGWVFDWTLNLNSAILSNPAVKVGWPIARDIANLGFILVMLIIAFSTILRMGDFTAKKALPKLIIAALLINFSLLFVGIFLDFTNIITNFFINQGITGAGNGVGISQAIIGMMNVVSLLAPPPITTNWTTFGAGMLTFIANLFFINIITAVTAITMWAMAIMFLIRYVYLGLLIIILPLAILAYVLGRGEWTKWLDAFVAKSLFAPIASLFIYLAIATAQEFGAMQISAQQASAAPGLSGITANIGSMIMIISILLFGLGLAESISGIGGGLASKMAKGAAAGILKGAASTALSPLSGIKIRGKSAMDHLADAGKNSKYGIVRGLTRPLRQVGATGKDFQKEWGGGMGIMTGVLSGIDEGMGGKGRASKEKEGAQFKARTATVDKSTKDRAKTMGWIETMPAGSTPAQITANADILNKAKQDVEDHLSKQKDDEKETALDKTKKYFEKENNIEQIIKDTGATRTEVDTAIQKHLGNINEARREIKLNKNIEIYQQQIDGLKIRLGMAAPANKAAIQSDIDKLQDKMDKLKDLL